MARSATTFEKGKSGNPGGRSKAVGPNGETNAQIAAPLVPLAKQTLEEVMKDKSAPHMARVTAARDVLDRAYGKPRPAEEGGDKPDMTQILAELIAKLPS